MNTKERLDSSCCGTTESGGKIPSTSDSPCCPPSGENKSSGDARTARRIVDIDFIYLDLSVCTRCLGAESRLTESIAEVANVLEATGAQVSVNNIHVTSEEQARDLGFVVSPTIRVNGRDIQMNFRESRCESCGTLCDCEGGVSCREWEYHGQWYTVPPKGLIVEAILKEIYGGTDQEPEVARRCTDVPDNLKRFFAGRK